MLRRLVTVLAAAAALVTTAAAPASAATPCRAGTKSPLCQVWTGKVAWVPDGDTLMIGQVQ
jgi:hypothetical protein